MRKKKVCAFSKRTEQEKNVLEILENVQGFSRKDQNEEFFLLDIQYKFLF